MWAIIIDDGPLFFGWKSFDTGGFDGDALLTRPSIELVTVNADVIRRAERQIESCEQCHPDDAEIPFDWILDRVTGSDPSVTDYIVETPAKRLQCRREIFEKTSIRSCVIRDARHTSLFNRKDQG